MLGSRRQGREAALQVLYLKDIGQKKIESIPEAVWSDEPLTSKTREFAGRLVDGVLATQAAIDPLIKKYTENWEMSRMAAIEITATRPLPLPALNSDPTLFSPLYSLYENRLDLLLL